MSRSQKGNVSTEHAAKGNPLQRLGRWFAGLAGWKKGVLIAALIVILVSAVVAGHVISKLNRVERVDLDEAELSCVDVDGYINILLLGVDSRDMDNIQGSGADAIMILSIKEETGDVKLMSVYRDTYMKMGDTDTYAKITDANRIGGPQLVIQSLNQAMDLNIRQFVVVNFKCVADLVNAVGGVEVDVQEEEISELNKYTIQTARNIGQKDYQLVSAPGLQKLEGVQAVSYGRIRKGVGDDFKRTERMRIVLDKVFDKLKTMSLGKLNDILDMLLPQVQTNLKNKDMMIMAMRLMDFNIKSGAGWPYEITGGYLDGLAYVFPDDLAANVSELHRRMFGREDYTPSEVVQTISAWIANVIYGSVTYEPPSDEEPSELVESQPEPEPEPKEKVEKPKPEPEPAPEPEQTPDPNPSDTETGGTGETTPDSGTTQDPGTTPGTDGSTQSGAAGT